jgi:ketosteroid isomerase-like protein
MSAAISSATDAAAPLTAAPESARELALQFFELLNRGRAEAALGLFDPQGVFEIVPAAVQGTVATEGRRFVAALLEAFPDLWIKVRSVMGNRDFATLEVKLEGTQAADFLGILNQEKHLDLDQAWMVWAAAGKLTRVRAYWCQNQLYRRLAVKRLDRISILG